jgi:predicted nucleic acid-binding protein
MINYSIGHLFRWLDKLKYDKCIHPLSKKEIEQYKYDDPQEAMTLKLDAYEELKTQAPLAKKISDLISSFDKTENDYIDTALLNEVFQKRVDILITEDKKLRNKAKKLGIYDKVLSINSFISLATSENPELIEYKALAVRKEIIGNIDINSEFFDSLRSAYSGFNHWFAKKSNEDAYICKDDSGRILGFLYLKTESKNENYYDISPTFAPMKRLKVGTFKVDSTGFRLGERFIQIIFDNAIERNVDEVYVTLFEDRPELQTLSNLLYRWGFKKHGSNTSTGETVLVKQMKMYDESISTKQNYPNLLYNKQKFIVPIYPKYHTPLLPDSILNNENEVDFLKKTPYKYALQKVYISFSPERNIQPGDIILFYRTGANQSPKKYTSVLTTIGIVDEMLAEFSSKNEFLRHCQNRSVFTKEELDSFWNKNRHRLIVLKFIFVKRLENKPILDFLWENGIIEQGKGPRPFTRISDNQFNLIMTEARTDLNRYWRK